MEWKRYEDNGFRKFMNFLAIKSSIHISMNNLLDLEKQLLNPATLVSCFLALQELGKIDNESTK